MCNELPDDREAIHISGAFRGGVVAADTGLANPADSVQRSPARPGSVGVGSSFQQQGRDFEVGVGDRDFERTRTDLAFSCAGVVRSPAPPALPGQRVVDVGARVEQGPNHILVPLAHGKQQGRESAMRSRSDLGPGPDQFVHSRKMTLPRGPHQCGLPTP